MWSTLNLKLSRQRVFALWPRKVGQGHSSSNSFKAMMGCITGSNFMEIGEGNLKVSHEQEFALRPRQEACRPDRGPDSSVIYNWLSGHIKFTKSQFKHCSKSLIWSLGSHVIICPNSCERLTKCEIRSNCSRFKHWPKSKLGKVGDGSNIAQNHSSSLQEVLSRHYLPQFTYKKLTKIKIRSSWSRFKYCSKSLV